MRWLISDRHIQTDRERMREREEAGGRERERGRKKSSSSSSWPREPRESTSELGSTQLESLPGRGWKNPCWCVSVCVILQEIVVCTSEGYLYMWNECKYTTSHKSTQALEHLHTWPHILCSKAHNIYSTTL